MRGEGGQCVSARALSLPPPLHPPSPEWMMSNVLVRDTVRMEALVSPGMWVWVWEEVASRDIGSMAVLQRHPAHELLVKRGARVLALVYFLPSPLCIVASVLF